jgi:hypothetical protein
MLCKGAAIKATSTLTLPRPNGFPSPPRVSFPRKDVRSAKRGTLPPRERRGGKLRPPFAFSGDSQACERRQYFRKRSSLWLLKSNKCPRLRRLLGLTSIPMWPTASFVTTPLINISVRHLKRAIVIRERMQRLEHELESILGTTSSDAANGHGGRRKMSASARAKIAAAQKLRWAKFHKSGGGKPGRKKMSAAARAKISAAAKARWAKAKAANRRTLAG